MLKETRAREGAKTDCIIEILSSLNSSPRSGVVLYFNCPRSDGGNNCLSKMYQVLSGQKTGLSLDVVINPISGQENMHA